MARDAWREVRLDKVLVALEERGDVEEFGAVNHAFVLATYFLETRSGVVELTDAIDTVVTMEKYLEVMKSMGEAFGNTFPGVAGNTAFQR